MPKRFTGCDKAVAIFEQRTFAISSTTNGYLPLLARSLTPRVVPVPHSSAIRLLVPIPLFHPPPSSLIPAPCPVLAVSPCFHRRPPTAARRLADHPAASPSHPYLLAHDACTATGEAAGFARQCLLEDLFQYFQLKLDKAVFDNACVFRRSSCGGKNNAVRASDQEWFSAASAPHGRGMAPPLGWVRRARRTDRG